MKEYLFAVLNGPRGKQDLDEATHLAFVKQCEVYIGELKTNGHLIAAQPLYREGIRISRQENGWDQQPVTGTAVQVGYYHIRAAGPDEAIAIAKQNPEFEYISGAAIEIREIKTKEPQTGFVYPA